MSRPKTIFRSIARFGWIAAVIFSATLGRAQAPGEVGEPGSSSERSELAKKLANPLANLISIPLQSTWTGGMGTNKESAFIAKLQPVVPFPLTEHWNLITRMIIPMTSLPALTPGGAPASGIGDVMLSAFISPAGSSSLAWGFGPALSLPSTNQPALGSQKWSAGPTAAAILRSGHWTSGALWNQLWSFAGATDRKDVSQMLFQPFAAYTTRSAVTYSVNLEANANWKAATGRWTAPVNAQVSKLASLGPLPASFGASFGWYVAKPDGTPSWQMRTTITLLLPRQRKTAELREVANVLHIDPAPYFCGTTARRKYSPRCRCGRSVVT